MICVVLVVKKTRSISVLNRKYKHGRLVMSSFSREVAIKIRQLSLNNEEQIKEGSNYDLRTAG